MIIRGNPSNQPGFYSTRAYWPPTTTGTWWILSWTSVAMAKLSSKSTAQPWSSSQGLTWFDLIIPTNNKTNTKISHLLKPRIQRFQHAPACSSITALVRHRRYTNHSMTRYLEFMIWLSLVILNQANKSNMLLILMTWYSSIKNLAKKTSTITNIRGLYPWIYPTTWQHRLGCAFRFPCRIICAHLWRHMAWGIFGACNHEKMEGSSMLIEINGDVNNQFEGIIIYTWSYTGEIKGYIYIYIHICITNKLICGCVQKWEIPKMTVGIPLNKKT